MENKLFTYEKIITINEVPFINENFNILRKSFEVLTFFIQDKCNKDNENLEYFQMNFTDSERSPFSKDLKIKWAVTKNV